jgi:nucleoside 2-deoxyribosyltransferase
MKYHAYVKYPGGSQGWRNHSEEALLKYVLVPFIQGQIVTITSKGKKHVLNMRACLTINVYKTSQPVISILRFRAQADSAQYECTAELLAKAKLLHATGNSASLLQQWLAKQKNQVFVVMKFGDKHMDSAYKMAIKPTVESFKMNCLRIDEINDSGRISDQILESIAASRFVLADLSGERPNCYYEAGFAHALGKELIFTIKKPEKIHFDLAGYRFMEWETEAELQDKLCSRLDALLSRNEVEEEVEDRLDVQDVTE